MDSTEVAKQLFFAGLKDFQQADFTGAEDKFRQALDLVPDRISIIVNLSATLLQLGNLGEARELLEKATLLEPDTAETWLNLGLVNAAESRHAEAIQCMDKAIELEPQYADAWMNKGHILSRQDKQHAALDHYSRALEIKPDLAEAHKSMAKTYAALGEHDLAVESYYKAIDIEPDNVSHYRNLGNIKKYKPGDDRFARLISLLDRQDRQESEKISLHFTLAKAYEDIDDVDSAFHHYQQANQLRKAELGYDISTDRRLFHSIKSLFADSRYDAAPSGVGSEHSIEPVLIIGMPRSGTSLVEQILASHSTVYGAGELGYLAKYAYAVLDDYQNTGIKPDIIKTSQEMMSHYLLALGEFEVDEKVIVDKMPMNFLWLGFVLTALPDVKIINLVRDPTAICWSNYKIYFPAESIGFAYDMQDLAEYYCLYMDLMRFWRDHFPGRIYDLDYETLTENQEVETRHLLKYCGLEWEDGCLEFEKTDRAVKTASHLQVRQGMYQGSSRAWRKYKDYIPPIVDIDCDKSILY